MASSAIIVADTVVQKCDTNFRDVDVVAARLLDAALLRAAGAVSARLMIGAMTSLCLTTMMMTDN